MPAFSIGEEAFELDGAPFRIISGALHYFRVHPGLWRDRMEKARALGLNTLETYVAWNFHSRRPGEFDLTRWRDLGAFLDLAAELGLHTIVRPGPYICAEWRNAGLPTWLTSRPGIRVRTSDPIYLRGVAEFYAHVLPLVAGRQITRGGNVLMVQVENEYGAYGDDKAYLRTLVDLVRAEGIDVPLMTCDQANDEHLSRGSLPELFTAGTFGSRSLERLETLRRYQPTGPLMCAEYWNGWFDSWGQHHHTTTFDEAARDLDDLLGTGASVNLYMLHGGTNFGLMNGANDKGVYVPITTSYDYDAPLREDGSPGPKFAAFRDVIARHAAIADAAPLPFTAAPAFTVPLHRGPAWTGASDGPGIRFDHLPNGDEVDAEAFFWRYATDVGPDAGALAFGEVRDHALCFLDGVNIGTLYRHHRERTLRLPEGTGGRLEILVADLGRVNYGSRLGESKGLIGPATSRDADPTDWQAHGVDLDRALDLARNADTEPLDPRRPIGGPVLLRATFEASGAADLFLATGGWGRGVVWINGFLLGRYWSTGPTRTLYVPAPLLREGANELVVWELAGAPEPEVRFVSHPDLGHTEP